MRVAFVASDIPDHALEFAEMMAESCDVLLCIPDKYRSPNRPRPNPRLEVAWLPWPRQRSLSNVIFMQLMWKRISGWKPDLVHFLSESNVWTPMLASFLKPVPIVTTVHDVVLHPGDASSRRVPRFFANALVRKSDAIIVHGERMRVQAARQLPISPSRVFVTPLVPPLLPSELGEQHNRGKFHDGFFRVLFFGRIYEYKGLKYLLEAIPLVRVEVPNVRLVVAGRGDDISKYIAHIEDLSSIEVHNRFISRSEAAQLFDEADIVAIPYIQASQSGPLMIALAFGVPVVATDVGELHDVVRSAGFGLLVPPRDTMALGAAITKIALDNNLRKRFSQNAKIAMNDTYSRKEISAKVIYIYQSLLDILNRSAENSAT